MKNILVPCDFSKCSNNAFKVANLIAEKSGGKITLLHIMDYSEHITSVFDMGVNDMLLVDVFNKMKADAEGKSVDLINSLNSNITVETKIVTGLPRDVINDELESNYDLVVMGTKGVSGVKEVFVGSNTERIVRDSRVPVLAVTEESVEFAPSRIVYASDFEEDNASGFAIVKQMAEIFGSKIHLVRINTPMNFESTLYAENRMEKFVKNEGLDNYSMEQFDYEQFELGLNRYIKRVDADVVALGTHGRKGLKYFYYGGSKAEDVVNHFSLPVLTFKLS